MPDPHDVNIILDRVADGDADAFRRLCVLLWKPLLCSATAALGAEQARHVANATFLEVWHLARYRRTDDPVRWLYEILSRRTVDRLIAGCHKDPTRGVCDDLVARELAAVVDGRYQRVPNPW